MGFEKQIGLKPVLRFESNAQNAFLAPDFLKHFLTPEFPQTLEARSTAPCHHVSLHGMRAVAVIGNTGWALQLHSNIFDGVGFFVRNAIIITSIVFVVMGGLFVLINGVFPTF